MTPNEYQQECLRTANGGINNHRLLLNGAIGACSETGEALDILKKHLFQGHELIVNRHEIHLFQNDFLPLCKLEVDHIIKRNAGFCSANCQVPSDISEFLSQVRNIQLMTSLVGLNTNTSKLLWYVYSLFTGDVDGAVSIKNLLSLCCFELSLSCHAIGATLQDICEENVMKLRTRYPRGFEIDRSLKREVGDE